MTPLTRRLALTAAAVTAIGLAAGPARAQVVITDGTDEGLACFKVVTPAATYFYDKAGAGFSSLLDKDGNDWIGYKPGGGASGEYRGIPNMGLGKFGHPGYTGATSTTSDPKGQQLPKVTITSKKGGWHVSWEIFATHAKMTVHAVEENYWILYEGTPGGAVGSDDTCHRSSGEQNTLDKAWEGDVAPSAALPGVEWVFFADGTLDRSLYLAHDEDGKTDRYYLMSPMTVFGFGRHAANLDRLLDATPATLIVGLVESRSVSTVAQSIAAAWGGTSPPPPQDAGVPPPPDAGVQDVGVQDAGTPPPPPPDSGTPPPADSGAPPPPPDDGGTPPPPPPADGDAPRADGDSPPGPDAGMPTDGPAGIADGAPGPSGNPADDRRLDGAGCAVSRAAAPSPTLPLVVVLIALAFVRRRSRY